MSNLTDTGIRPYLDHYLTAKSEEIRNYGDYWSASSAGYCMRLNILRRLRVPKVPEIAEKAAQSQLTFEAGHMLHWWLQKITKDAGLSIAQELELQDEGLTVRGHIDDLVLVTKLKQLETAIDPETGKDAIDRFGKLEDMGRNQRLILYDYKSTHASSFKYKSKTPIGHCHRMQLGTYMHMLRKDFDGKYENYSLIEQKNVKVLELTEARILTIDKNSLVDWEPELRTHEHQLLWTDELAKDVTNYWHALNGYWEEKILPACTCHLHDGGFMARRSKNGRVYNDYFYNDTPCAETWFKDKLPEGWHV